MKGGIFSHQAVVWALSDPQKVPDDHQTDKAMHHTT